jgi:surfactin synthase thioesterase subunit
MRMQPQISLLCLPCAGASATMYFRWRRLLPRWIDLAPVELPGRGSRSAETFVEDFDALVDRLCAEQAGARRGRYAFFGHSMGALLAYGMTRRLLATGLAPPSALLVSGSPAPSRREPERFAGKDDDEALIADLRKLGGTPEEVFGSHELMRITLDMLRADYRICESFRFRGSASLDIPIHVFAGRQDEIEPESVSAWSEEARAGVTLDWFDGGHFFIRQQEDRVVSALVRRLSGVVTGELDASCASI